MGTGGGDKTRTVRVGQREMEGGWRGAVLLDGDWTGNGHFSAHQASHPSISVQCLLVDAEARGLHRSQLWFAAQMSVGGGGWLSKALVGGIRDECLLSPGCRSPSPLDDGRFTCPQPGNAHENPELVVRREAPWSEEMPCRFRISSERLFLWRALDKHTSVAAG